MCLCVFGLDIVLTGMRYNMHRWFKRQSHKKISVYFGWNTNAWKVTEFVEIGKKLRENDGA